MSFTAPYNPSIVHLTTLYCILLPCSNCAAMYCTLSALLAIIYIIYRALPLTWRLDGHEYVYLKYYLHRCWKNTHQNYISMDIFKLWCFQYKGILNEITSCWTEVSYFPFLSRLAISVFDQYLGWPAVTKIYVVKHKPIWGRAAITHIRVFLPQKYKGSPVERKKTLDFPL